MVAIRSTTCAYTCMLRMWCLALCWIILEARNLSMLLEELGKWHKESTRVWKDNKAAIMIAEAESSSAGRAKRIDVRFKKVVEIIGDGTVRGRYVITTGRQRLQLCRHHGEGIERDQVQVGARCTRDMRVTAQRERHDVEID